MLVEQFLNDHKWPILPELTSINYDSLTKRSSKQLLIIVNPTPEIQNVVEVNFLNKVYPQLN